MPLLDVSDLLTDPDFASMNIVCQRSVQTVGEDGMAVNTPTSISFTGVVTSDDGDILERLASGERIKGSISIITRFRLSDGRGVSASGNPATTADIVLFRGRNYTVSSVNDYSQYGRGFVEASCDLIPLSG